jgi:serine/threonine-protein kinase RsbW/sigma-B regulation protein RsbU (phosphoserine phosphatase)
MKQKFPRSFDSLAGILEFTDDFFADLRVEPGVRYAVDLAIDEIFTNMVKYNAKSPADIGLEFAIGDDDISVTLVDYQSEYFDITKARPVDITLPAADRAIGGLGIHLVHQMVDSLEYNHNDGVSMIVFTKKTGIEHV